MKIFSNSNPLVFAMYLNFWVMIFQMGMFIARQLFTPEDTLAIFFSFVLASLNGLCYVGFRDKMLPLQETKDKS